MGFFSNVVICDLQEDAAGITPHVNLLTFENERWVSWQTNEHNETKESRADQTIFFDKMGKISNEQKYTAKLMIRKRIRGFFKKTQECQFSPQFENLSTKSLMHIVLPNLYLPNMKFFGELHPHVKKKDSRIALTWPFENRVEVEIYFRKVGKKEFDNFGAAGTEVREIISQEVREGLRSTREEIGKETKDVGTTVLAKLIEQLVTP